ncbi:hypothetical protein EMIHUDRAFT_239482 [Emiliania huxleyi CCMP1516]|uniref:Uncharacterized protein n=2 Tax=Emiliania huxleyi TaxID=2903 RepID=A0A0D3JJ89_EMIH1|nr:hypothetical protein EMIHUDRAFT_239482 [Emiliania huxleyi CCMP1516]EOD23574.1 hypothetical protein EMIHUDRAFT_239482 [Emiliania huxleyi CCMP1516]|eukprot:XP_005776003.1 hypothetical protein EMIHUDRAFT_239482 [Emiliania huxleyi CCMP1516]
MPAAGAPFSAPSLVANDDDTFRSIAVLRPPADPAIGSESPVPVGELSAGCLDGTLAQLLAAGRYEEALASQQHLDAVAQLAVQQNEYERAKENDELEEAIHIKKDQHPVPTPVTSHQSPTAGLPAADSLSLHLKVVLPALRARLASDPAAWSRPVAPPYATAGTLAAEAASRSREAVSRFGEAEAAPFARLCSADLSSVAASDLPAAAAKLRRLRAAHVLLMETSEAILRTMTDAEALVSALPPSAGSAERAAALRSPKAARLPRRFLSRMARFRRSRVPKKQSNRRAAAVAAPDDEAPEPPLNERCALSLLPLQSANAFPELPPTVAWEGKRCHAPCVNLWLHGVKQAWPAV